MIKKQYDEVAVQDVVLAWAYIKGEEWVPRMGYDRYGVYKVTKHPEYGKLSFEDIHPGSVDSTRPESILEHSNGVLVILRAIEEKFPRQVFSYWRDWQDAKDLALLHEIGETGTGDICDDGTRGANYDLLERRFMENASRHLFSEQTAERLFKRFIEFQEKSTFFGQIVYMADKIEAVLHGLLLEKAGSGGKLNMTIAKPLEIEGARFANSYDLADVWLYPFVLNARKYEYFQLFLEIAITAGQIARGKEDPFPWVEKLLKK